jgi:hypothetical protein
MRHKKFKVIAAIENVVAKKDVLFLSFLQTTPGNLNLLWMDFMMPTN